MVRHRIGTAGEHVAFNGGHAHPTGNAGDKCRRDCPTTVLLRSGVRRYVHALCGPRFEWPMSCIINRKDPAQRKKLYGQDLYLQPG